MRTLSRSLSSIVLGSFVLLSSSLAIGQEKAAKSKEVEPSAKKTPVIIKDIRYRETLGVDAVHQSLDIYAPAEARNASVIIYVHGGGWSKGDKAAAGNSLAPNFFNQAGWIFISINYRLLPDGKHPNNVDDVAHAVAWIHSNIANHGGDPNKLFLYGHSAGAHLSALVATDEKRLKGAGKELTILRGVIPLDTNCYDLNTLIANDTGLTYKAVFGTDPKNLTDASPSAHIARGKGIPPMLVFHSGTGAETRSAQATAFVAKLQEAAFDAIMIPSVEQTHGQINQQFGEPGDKVTEAAWKFLSQLNAGIQ